MSFILDALKKSEGDRQRQSGPAFFEVKVAPPKARFPAWAIAVGALLAVNLGVVAWLATRNAEPAAPVAMARATDAPPSPARASAPPVASLAEPVALSPEIAPAPAEIGDFEPELFAEEDYEPAVSETLAPTGRVTRGTALGVPTYDQLAGSTGVSLPELRLDLHVFANEPGDRFIFLNNTRLREGEAMRDGTRVESIVPDGAVLSVRGTRFLLQRQ